MKIATSSKHQSGDNSKWRSEGSVKAVELVKAPSLPTVHVFQNSNPTIPFHEDGFVTTPMRENGKK